MPPRTEILHSSSKHRVQVEIRDDETREGAAAPPSFKLGGTETHHIKALSEQVLFLFLPTILCSFLENQGSFY